MEKAEIDPFVARMVSSTMNTMRGIIEGGEEARPMIFCLAKEGDGPAVFPILGLTELFCSPEGKRGLKPVMKMMWAKIAMDKPSVKLVAVLMLSDIWVEKVSKEEGAKILRDGRAEPFRPKPGMGEEVYAQVSFADAEFQYHWPYVRSEGGVVFTPEAAIVVVKSDPNIQGTRLMGMWPL